MFYYQIALRQVRDLFTWQSQTPLPLGARVVVSFRHKQKIGLVVASTPKPDFKTAEIEAVLETNFLLEESLLLAQHLAAQHFTPLGKILGLMVPEPFWQKASPIKIRQAYQLVSEFKSDLLRHPTQKQFYQWLQTESIVWSDNVPGIYKNTFKTFLKKTWLEPTTSEIIPERSLPLAAELPEPLTLTTDQAAVLESLKKLQTGALLWGVTGSGKTEVYKQYFQSLLAADTTAQFLFLLPEIALTPQLIAQFQMAFGAKVAVWHSNLTPAEKVQAWARLQSGEAQVLVGTRSAALVPIPKLKAIVMDEEHEWTFKNEFSPRFWAHEIVEFLAKQKSVPYVYGSATPKLRTYHKAQTARLQLLELPNRIGDTALPSIELVDLVQEAKRGNFSPVSSTLTDRINETLQQGKQVVLFLNKRGFAGATLCRYCGHTFHCENCDMTLKLHRNNGVERLLCHVCGSMKHFPACCPECSKTDFTLKGWGTQQLEAQLKQQWPDTPIFRADRDTITGRYDFEQLMNQFKQAGPSILLGTQMIAKGLDFESVALVGIVLADVGLGLPDYSAEERVYQLLEQVSGRAGRRATQGRIVVQTFQRDAPLFQFLRQHDTKGFMAAKYAEHKKLGLPPFSHMVKVIAVDKSKGTAFAACKNLHDDLKKALQAQGLEAIIHLAWAPAFFPRLHAKYWFYVFLQSADESVLQKFVQSYDWPKEVKIDVNPASLL